MSKKFVCRKDDVPANGMKAFEAEGGLKVLILDAGAHYYACQAMCPHQETPLEDGFFDGCVLTCNQHLWQWEVATGAPVSIAETPLEYYQVEIQDGSIYVVAPKAAMMAELFTGLPEAILSQIVNLVQSETRESGSVIYNAGDPADDLYILESGRVQFSIGRDDRVTQAGFVEHKGEAFGWVALLESHPYRLAKAVCLDKCALQRIEGKRLLEVLESDPASGYLVMRRLSLLIMRQLMATGAR